MGPDYTFCTISAISKLEPAGHAPCQPPLIGLLPEVSRLAIGLGAARRNGPRIVLLPREAAGLHCFFFGGML